MTKGQEPGQEGPVVGVIAGMRSGNPRKTSSPIPMAVSEMTRPLSPGNILSLYDIVFPNREPIFSTNTISHEIYFSRLQE